MIRFKTGKASALPLKSAGLLLFAAVLLMPSSAASESTQLSSRLDAADFSGPLKEAFDALAQNKPQKALDELNRAERSRKKPARDRLWLLRGLALQSLNRHREAIESFKRSLELKASSSDTLFLLGVSRMEAAQPEEAAAALEEAVWFNKFRSFRSTEAQALLGSAYLALPTPQPAKAQSVLSAAAVADPNSADVRWRLGQLQLSAGDRASAIASLRAASEGSPGNNHIQLDLAQALLLNANRIVHRSEIAQAAALSSQVANAPNASNELRQRARIINIRALLANAKFDEARGVLGTARKNGPDNEDLKLLEQQIQLEQAAMTPPAN